jgi:hypothetical protein
MQLKISERTTMTTPTHQVSAPPLSAELQHTTDFVVQLAHTRVLVVDELLGDELILKELLLQRLLVRGHRARNGNLVAELRVVHDLECRDAEQLVVLGKLLLADDGLHRRAVGQLRVFAVCTHVLAAYQKTVQSGVRCTQIVQLARQSCFGNQPLLARRFLKVDRSSKQLHQRLERLVERLHDVLQDLDLVAWCSSNNFANVQRVQQRLGQRGPIADAGIDGTNASQDARQISNVLGAIAQGCGEFQVVRCHKERDGIETLVDGAERSHRSKEPLAAHTHTHKQIYVCA